MQLVQLYACRALLIVSFKEDILVCFIVYKEKNQVSY